MENKQAIWIAEDEAEIRQLVQDYLLHAGFACQAFPDGQTLLNAFEQETGTTPDLVILDIMMPGIDGYEVCRQLRTFSRVPILFLSAKNDEIDRLLGLKLGADDYLVKPVSPREIVARAEAILRRVAWAQNSAPSQSSASQQTHVEDQLEEATSSKLMLELNEPALQIKINQQQIQLTAVEFNLFKVLWENPERVFRREELLNHAYSDYRVVSDRTVDSHIKNLRAKLQPTAGAADLIQSVYGVGYRLVLPF